MPSYKDCLFYAEKTSAHKGARLAGTVLVVARRLTSDMRNGSCIKAIATPKGDPNGVPCATWVGSSHFATVCVEVSEATAREIAPRMFEALERYDASAFFRTGHAFAVAEGIKTRRYPVQPADAAVIALLPTTVPVPVRSAQGFERARGNRA